MARERALLGAVHEEGAVVFARNGPSEAFSFRGSSSDDLVERLRDAENGYGCLYWIDAEVVYELHPGLRRCASLCSAAAEEVIPARPPYAL